MKDKCDINWLVGVITRSLPEAHSEPIEPAPSSNSAGLGTITFELDTAALGHVGGRVPIPGYNAPGLPMKPVRDAALSLIALGGIDPATPVMVEVPRVQDSVSYMEPQTLAGIRIGFAEHYQRGSDFEPVVHSAAFLGGLRLLCQAGAQLVPVCAQHRDDRFHFDVQSHNEIDDLVARHRLDALVSEGDRGAFHHAWRDGYPKHSEMLEDGVRLWIYGNRGAHARLHVLSHTCQRLFTQPPVVKPAPGG